MSVQKRPIANSTQLTSTWKLCYPNARQFGIKLARQPISEADIFRLYQSNEESLL
jgi:hypothetical protein